MMEPAVENADKEAEKEHERRCRLINVVFKSRLTNTIIPSHIIPNFVECGIEFSEVKAKEIQAMERRGKCPAACEKMFDTIFEENGAETGWFSALILALRLNGYESCVNLLECESFHHEDDDKQQRLVRIFESNISGSVQLDNILPSVCQYKLINDHERDEILAQQRNEGHYSAMNILLSIIHKKQKNWFPLFIRVLSECEYENLARVMEPDTLDKVKNGVYDNEGNSDSEKYDTEKPEKSCHKSKDDIDSSAAMFQLNIAEPGEKLLLSAYDGRDLDKDNMQLKQSYVNGNSVSNVGGMSNNLNESNAGGDKVQDKNIQPSSGSADSDISLPEVANADNSNIAVNDPISTPKPGTDGTSSPELKLRCYQKELAEAGLDGKNVIICAPTGSGKTHVALHICEEHLKESAEAKIVFFCNQVALADQQWKGFEKYLNEYKSIALTGDVTNSSKGPLDEIINQNDIIIMTPQILLDSIKKKIIDTLSKTFTLMIFDECHHAHKKHPYSLIMHEYLEEKFQSIKDKTHIQMPQVIGLTASLGVGKANTAEQAQKHILSLCANLDVEEVCTVENHIEELKQFANVPVEEIEAVNRRTNDPFINEIHAIMTKIEQNMQQTPDAGTVNEVPNFVEELQPPPDKGSDQYTQWSSNLRGKVVRIYEQKVRRLFLESVNHLMVYNEALLLGDWCRRKDALNLLKEKFHSERPVFDDIDRWLDGLFKDKLALFDELAKTDNNPKLAKLREMILKAYEEKPETHGIIFVKTRALTEALRNWISETSDLEFLNPGKLVGSNAASDKDGMTQYQQINLLKLFRDGKHKIIIATSVAEEGLDIRSCNLVVKYLHVTNEIAMVQGRGRTRAEESRYIVLAEKGSGIVEKEQINIIRENMMKNALKEIKKMTKDDFNKCKDRYQDEAKFERETRKATIAAVRRTNSDTAYQLRCVKCDNFACMSTDFRTVLENHHVVTDEEVLKRIKWKRQPQPQVITKGEFEKLGKIHCMKCDYDWGIEILHKQAKLPVLKLQSFILVDFNDQRLPLIKKWKNAPFQVQPLTHEDLLKILNVE